MADKGTDQAVTRREHDALKEAKRVIDIDPFGGLVTKGNFKTIIDSSVENTTFIGKAQIGAATSAAQWQIKKVLVNGTTVSITWGNGTDAFTNKWDDHLTISYS